MREQPISEAVPLRWYSDLLEDADFYRGQEHEISKERAIPALVKAVAGSKEVRFFVVHLLDPDTLKRALIEIVLDPMAGEAVGVANTETDVVGWVDDDGLKQPVLRDVWTDPIRFRSAPDFELALDHYLAILQERGDL
ncbi:hypothetical protein U8P76_30900 (plasmid) [Rhizobium johnstonii]|uniref:hypothetical protein n=1 Tax=Rhizobium TaxID=379 RepID=UPI0010325483|nr:hypothetical protein [Rhizobium leguminosarum]WSG98834.1 hypothetical protein U8P76_30900 [Rhizobium johnstonii]NEI02160.1 hypothetical protein [Rhizobium leguminosarum]NEJ43058.1 hypothetical protein [Rhizobium leguminosarum]NEJ49963.1 hypothetical protein [Rhizobium leguminosarum]TBH48308.1 hypothetical protein ELG62_31405 [Rhizobium leguminosarum]